MKNRFLNSALVVLMASLPFACAPLPKATPIAEIPELADKEALYKIGPGDVLDIKFFYTPDLDETVAVRPDGMISLRLVDDVKAAGRTPKELDDALTALYKSRLPEKPDLSVIVRGFESQRVYVTGEVRAPGELPLKSGLTVMQAVTAAGGLLNTARPDSILVVRKETLKGRDAYNAAVYRVNMSDPMLGPDSGGGAFAALEPTDIVYVPKSGIAQANLFVDQYVKNLFLINGLSLGVSGVYELNNKDPKVPNQ